MASNKEEDSDDWQDWEDFNGEGKFSHHVVAGSCAGIVEHLAIFPLDTLRTFKQTHVIDSSKVTLRSLYKEGGIARLYRGASSVFTGCIPAHAAYFSIYEFGKKHLVDTPGHHPFAAAMCGAAATLAHDSIMTPLDVVKQRLQLGFYSGMFDCLRKVVHHEGARALFVSFPTTLLMNIPYGGVMVAANESLKTILNPSGERNIPAFFVSGAGAGALAAFVTNPLDVAKTRLQTQCILLHPAGQGLSVPGSHVVTGSHIVTTTANTTVTRTKVAACTSSTTKTATSKTVNKLKCETFRCTAQKGGAAVESCKVVRFTGLLDTLRLIFKHEGLRGFARGLQPRLIAHTPAVATTWTTYEVVKRLLNDVDP